MAWCAPARTEGTKHVIIGINSVGLGTVMAVAMELTACLQEANCLIHIMVWDEEICWKTFIWKIGK
jgi:hypothetical protein